MGIAKPRLPYGLADFNFVRTQNHAYVDKTAMIGVLERFGRCAVVVRPRRFGKSLFTDTLLHYYDRSFAGSFDALFAGTGIANQKDGAKNSLYVLMLDFSGVTFTPGGYVKDFTRNIRLSLSEFFFRHPIPGHEEFLRRADCISWPGPLISEFFDFVLPVIGRRIFVVIDEFDHFANYVLTGNREFLRFMESEEGTFSDFYSRIAHEAGTDGAVAGVFITGVSCVGGGHMSSVFSAARNLSFEPDAADMFGFTENELRNLIGQVLPELPDGQDRGGILERLKSLYGGYRFSPGCFKAVINPSMCFHYLGILSRWGEEPENIFDPGSAVSAERIRELLTTADAKDVERVVSMAVGGEPIPFDGMPETIGIDSSGKIDCRGLLSALVFLGYLTYAAGDGRHLVVPNIAIGQQFARLHSG